MWHDPCAGHNARRTETRENLPSGHARCREQAQALEWYNKTFSKSVGAGMKLDVLFSIIRIGFFFSDMSLTSSTIDKARTYVPHCVGGWRGARPSDWRAGIR